MSEYHINQSNHYIKQVEGKAFFMHLVLYAIVHALLAIALEIKELRNEKGGEINGNSTKE